MRYSLTMAYKGTAYHGWQRQENAHSVQAELEKALSVLCRQTMEVVGCGRTDTGVHARHYVAHFDFDGELPGQVVYRLNGLLPKDIAVSGIEEVSDDFHARFSALARTYGYYIHFKKDPFLDGLSWQRNDNMDFELMNSAAEMLSGKRDFSCFCKGEAPNGNFICDVHSAAWERTADTAVFRISADRFLRNMVRAIVGTLLDVGLHKMSLAEFQELLNSGTRSDAGNSVPAEGLFLERIEY